MRTTLRTLAVIAAALVAAPAAVLADAPTAAPTSVAAPVASDQTHVGLLDFEVGALTLWRVDPGFTAFSSNPGSGLDLAAGIVVWEPAAHFSVAPELGYRHEDRSASLLQAANADLQIDVFSAGVRFRWEPVRWLSPFVRGALGYEHHGASVGSTLGGDGSAIVGTVGAGLELDLPLGPGVTGRGHGVGAAALGVVVEGGVVLGSRDVVTVAPRTPPGELPSDVIGATPVRLGAFDQTAPYLRLALVLRM